ncbi:MAG TPA: hypothetical protein VGK48_28690 [Terriglobia bacterium]
MQIDAQYRQGDEREAARQLLGAEREPDRAKPQWKIDRDVLKPATMTVPYGVTRRTIYKQLLDRDRLPE